MYNNIALQVTGGVQIYAEGVTASEGWRGAGGMGHNEATAGLFNMLKSLFFFYDDHKAKQINSFFHVIKKAHLFAFFRPAGAICMGAGHG